MAHRLSDIVYTLHEKCDHCHITGRLLKTPNGMFYLCEDCYYGLLEDKIQEEKEYRMTEGHND